MGQSIQEWTKSNFLKAVFHKSILEYFVPYMNDFLMILNRGTLRILSSITDETVKRQEKEKQKSMKNKTA